MFHLLRALHEGGLKKDQQARPLLEQCLWHWEELLSASTCVLSEVNLWSVTEFCVLGVKPYQRTACCLVWSCCTTALTLNKEEAQEALTYWKHVAVLAVSRKYTEPFTCWTCCNDSCHHRGALKLHNKFVSRRCFLWTDINPQLRSGCIFFLAPNIGFVLTDCCLNALLEPSAGSETLCLNTFMLV